MDSMKARVKKLLEKDDDLTIWFTLRCEDGVQAIEAQAWQMADVLNEDENEVRDAMLELAHELLPDSPAGAEDPRQVLFREMGVWASKQDQEVQDRLTEYLADGDGFDEAWESGLASFREYLRGKCKRAARVVTAA